MKNKKNKVVTISIIVFVGIVIICTYFSKTIKNMLLPEVTVCYAKPGTIGESFETTGTIQYENTHKIYPMSNWQIKQICVKLNQDVKKGDVLAKVDNDEISLKEKEEQEVIMQLQDEINSLKKAPAPDQDKIKENQYKLDTENIKYKAIRKGLTNDGSILSDVDGKVVSINSQNGQSPQDAQSDSSSSSQAGDNIQAASNALFEIISSDATFSVKWTASTKDAEGLSIGDTVNVTAQDGENSNAETAAISEKKYDSTKDEYEFLATISGKSDFKENDKVTVSTQGNIKKYNNVIPKSCLYDDNGVDYIYAVKAKDGALENEEYVERIQVKVIDSDSLNCSIKSVNNGQLDKSNYGIVSSSSKSINDNSEVKLVTTEVSR
ncbi:HlyD family secretion protein [Clostridium acetobutylicum]|uniref:Sugar-binding periplasmic protein n=1 Tax=Clostridium acetobutylicum (strain ATCC 824 / DSM 792 / JCM 1419 / IAM 19013 / LMG 5710 / NBRC 13948 / NRRL B-527 / VKM B-1787 / 2291 / W) TaxID=272562 RepID=Q97L95_CLOAB|nr:MULTISPECIES: efflux RND transporter periplasmic adaptor subunit [Clostridium]AAK78644.1 Sugar-binding periplasmic protein [Clostridium acetobutylicum ATCC 824]ADZ19718.1 Sugar-binding periplasmic protein [Clostridium acetobutylicum EA 2018]AEI31368.1 sugar-binding periplasmic protein [Clostridium acetobutylicum DSM 1731]AWV80365.1 efflux RND transporter periplasmic adaptor subunit [Clostridium acetobutylicum]MBC2392553.1 efflux RND transporter periplasmic adaptor subunit [Clostridium aceto